MPAEWLRQNLSKSSKRQLSTDWFIIGRSALFSFDSSQIIDRRKANYFWKLSPALLALRHTANAAQTYTILVQADGSVPLMLNPANAKITYRYHQNIVQLTTTFSFIWQTLIRYPAICFIDVQPTPPKEEMVINDYDNSVNAMNNSNGQYKNAHGFANITGSFKQAKNIITVGSVDSFYHVPVASSKSRSRHKRSIFFYSNAKLNSNDSFALYIPANISRLKCTLV